jgi:hypothetical protein
LLTVTTDGRPDTYSKMLDYKDNGAYAAAAEGVRVAMERSRDGRPTITARGMGAVYIKMEANRSKLQCEVRQAHPNRGRGLPPPIKPEGDSQ